MSQYKTYVFVARQGFRDGPLEKWWREEALLACMERGRFATSSAPSPSSLFRSFSDSPLPKYGAQTDVSPEVRSPAAQTSFLCAPPPSKKNVLLFCLAWIFLYSPLPPPRTNCCMQTIIFFNRNFERTNHLGLRLIKVSYEREKNQPEPGLTWAVCRYISCLRGIFFLPFTLVLVSSFGMYSTRKYLCHRKYLYQRKYWFTHSLKYMFCGMDKKKCFYWDLYFVLTEKVLTNPRHLCRLSVRSQKV